jgi:uncharacterized membrane protein
VDINNVTDNRMITGSDGGRATANLIYILYIAGFFFLITTLVGYIMAVMHSRSSMEPYASHFRFQRNLFIKGLWLTTATIVTWALASVLTALTFGLGIVLFIVPFGIGIWFTVAMIKGIIEGMGALGRGELAKA